MKKVLSIFLVLIMITGMVSVSPVSATDLTWNGGTITLEQGTMIGSATLSTLSVYNKNNTSAFPVITNVTQEGSVINITLAEDTDPSYPIQLGFAMNGGYVQNSGNTCTLQNGQGTATVKVQAKPAPVPNAPVLGEGTFVINFSVPMGTAYDVTPPTGEGFSFFGDPTVYEGSDYSFKISVNEGYDGSNMTVRVNNNTLEADNGNYTVYGVTENLIITVEGLYKKQLASVVFAEGEGYTVASEDMPYIGEAYTFTVTVDNAYNSDNMQVLLDDETELFAENGVYTIPALDGDHIVTITGLRPKHIYTVTKPDGDGFTFTGVEWVYEGEDYGFTVMPNAGLAAIVRVNGEVISSSDNTYTVGGVLSDLVIAVETQRAPLPEKELPVADNRVDITDATIYSRSKYYANAVDIKIGGAVVTSAYEDGKTVFIILGSGTADEAHISIEFGTSLNRCTMSGHTASYTLSGGEGILNMTLTGSYSSNMKASATYTLIFIREEATDIPKRLAESDTLSTYTGVGIDINLSKYFEGASEYYLADGENKTPIESNIYKFLTMSGGEHTLVFSASNKLGDCADTVTVTIYVTAIESGIWVGHNTSNGSLDYILFRDADGNLIDGIEVSCENKIITATLPKTYPVTGKVTAEFSLSQNESGYPFLSTKTATSGTSSSQAVGNKFTSKTIALSSGAGSLTFYYFNSAPTGSNQETFTLVYKVANDLPVLTGDAFAEATIEANKNYALDLTPLFTDADGDSLEYSVSINGTAATSAEANYTFSTDIAGTYTLVFTASDGKGTSKEVYTVTLTVENSAETNSMRVYLPVDLTADFYTTIGFEGGTDQLGVELEAIRGETYGGMTAYEVRYPINAEMISVRTDGYGGMAFASVKDGEVTLRKAQFSVVDYENKTTESTNKVTYGENTAVAGDDGWLLVCGIEYVFGVAPTDSILASAKKTVTPEAGDDVYTAEFSLGLNNPVSITVPTGAKAQLYKYNQYYSNTELDAKIITNNDNGTTTYQFVADLNAHGATFVYRVSMEGKITKAGWLGWNEQNLTVTYTENDKEPAYRLDDYSATGEENSDITEDSVLLNVNSRNHLNLSVGESKTLKAYRAWEIIPVSYNNYIIPPDFDFTILSGNDVVSLTEKSSPSACDGDWMTLTALKEGIAIIEVTYDAIDIRDSGSTVHYSGVFGASDPARSGLLVVQVGENDDSSVKFGIDSFTGIGVSGSDHITYNPDRKKEWDVEFDTLYFLENSRELTLKPTASSDITDVSVSHDKGLTWKSLIGENGVYTADIVSGNNILRVSTLSGTAYQVVRGDKISVKLDEVPEKSDEDGVAEPGETIRVYLIGLHNPIPKMAGNYNPGYGGNNDGYSSQHLNYTCNGNHIYGTGAQYNFITSADFVEVVMPEDGGNLILNDGYIGLGVMGLTAFFDGGDSHRNIPDNGCTTRGDKTTYHTRSILPDITVSAGDTTAPNSPPVVRIGAITEKTIYSDQNFAINPDTLFADPDDDAMTFTVSVNGSEAAEAPLDYKFTPVGTGTYILLFTAADGKETVQHSITLTVTNRPSQGGGIVGGEDEFGLDESEIAGYVTISFEDKGKRVSGESGLKYPKALGTIISATKVPFKKGEKITHVTKRLLDHLGIRMEYTGTLEKGFYLGAICDFELKGTPYDSMGEFDAGVGSGWMITFNKKFIEYGASEFVVKNGDTIRWQYTCQLGKDIGDPFYSGSSASSSSNKSKKTETEKKADNEEPKAEETDKEPGIQEKPVFTETTFDDIKKGDWHYEAVRYVYENGFMQGTESGFEPESNMSRAMLVTVLYRMANPENAETGHSFKDVPGGQWYSDAISWAASKGIVNGITDTEFAPDMDISREQMVLIIYRFAKMQGLDVSDVADVSAFTDTDKISDRALDAMKWANKTGLLNGTSETTLSPKDTATRAQVATILMRFCKTFAK